MICADYDALEAACCLGQELSIRLNSGCILSGTACDLTVINHKENLCISNPAIGRRMIVLDDISEFWIVS